MAQTHYFVEVEKFTTLHGSELLTDTLVARYRPDKHATLEPAFFGL
jgi:hypothetical protein